MTMMSFFILLLYQSSRISAFLILDLILVSFFHSAIAQSVEHPAVNGRVPGSSPGRGAKLDSVVMHTKLRFIYTLLVSNSCLPKKACASFILLGVIIIVCHNIIKFAFCQNLGYNLII
jgi:hypothetical protein